MLYVILDSNKEVKEIHSDPMNPDYGLGKTMDELLVEGMFLEAPVSENIPKHYEILKYDKVKKQLYYEYVPMPLTQEEEIQQLKEELALTKTAIDDLIMGGMM